MGAGSAVRYSIMQYCCPGPRGGRPEAPCADPRTNYDAMSYRMDRLRWLLGGASRARLHHPHHPHHCHTFRGTASRTPRTLPTHHPHHFHTLQDTTRTASTPLSATPPPFARDGWLSVVGTVPLFVDSWRRCVGLGLRVAMSRPCDVQGELQGHCVSSPVNPPPHPLPSRTHHACTQYTTPVPGGIDS